jgi:predicted nuclease of restriction endonuclease-like (RecB) superfamily
MSDFLQQLVQIITDARAKAGRVVNFIVVEAYWKVGRRIVEEEQEGKHRAEYGANILGYVSAYLTDRLGKGFDPSNLSNMRKFYRYFPNFDAVRQELSWTHYRYLLRVESSEGREFYIEEAITNGWSTRALDRQINTLYYERLLSSSNRSAVRAEMLDKTKALQAEDVLKDPYILEFLQLRDNSRLREVELEQALINQLQAFLLELGKGFAFVARQKRISTETKHFYIDLVFYNFLLKCFILVDLKVEELTHTDIGQMDMYVRLYEDQYRSPDDNPTIGLILCTYKDQTIVKYSVLNDNKQLFASRYKLFLPSEEELRQELERERQFIEQQKNL